MAKNPAPKKPASAKPKPEPAPLPGDELIRTPYSAIAIEEDFNVRRDFGDDLTESILQSGILSPLIGYRQDDTLMLVEGERRYRALEQLIGTGKLTLEAPQAQVPFLVRQRYADPVQRTAAMLTFGTTGKPLTMSERARGCQRLRSTGMDNVQIAAHVHTTPTAVADCLDLLEIVSPEVLAAVDAGRIAATTALELAREVADYAQQTEYFQAACLVAGPDSRVSAKHFSIPLGKAAKAKRTGVTTIPPVTAASCRLCGCTEADCQLCIDKTGTPCTWAEPDLCSRCQAQPFVDSEEGDGADHEGRLWKHTAEEVPMPEDSRTKVTLLIAFRADRHRYGYQLKWPGVFRPGAKHQKGFTKELPRVDGPGAPDEDKARLFAAQAARCELEVQDYAEDRGNKAAALQALADYITQLGGTVGGETHQPEPPKPEEDTRAEETEQAAPTVTPASRHPAPGLVPAPPPDFADTFKAIESLRLHYVACRSLQNGTPKIDVGIASLLTFLDTARRREREDTAKLIEREKLLAARIGTLESMVKDLERQRAENQSAGGEVLMVQLTRDTLAILASVIANAPPAEDREPGRLEALQFLHDGLKEGEFTLLQRIIETPPPPAYAETLRVVAAAIEGRLGSPEKIRSTLMQWTVGVFQSYEEVA